MAFARHMSGAFTATPFLYPFFDISALPVRCARRRTPFRRLAPPLRRLTTTRPLSAPSPTASRSQDATYASTNLNPAPDDYSLTPFADKCILTLHAGGGGHGCVSFVREKYIEEGPPNGGDGGTGGSIYIQAVAGETSLHKLARRGVIKAGRGRNGAGKNQGGERGGDVLLKVPVGTVVREIWRYDPVAEEEARVERERRRRGITEDEEEDGKEAPPLTEQAAWDRRKWVVYPGTIPSVFAKMQFPALTRVRRNHLQALEPQAPIRLDLDEPMERPMLLAAGAMGGLGNPHFVTTHLGRPKFASKGDDGLRLQVQLELKLLADVGLVGLPNAGKSTLLRALSNSRARVGHWAFTTLQPNIGTVVLDDHKGRPAIRKRDRHGTWRTHFTIADIPGLIEDAHLDKGLGLGFLRHIERAAVLAFVVDLSAGDAVATLQALWKEVGEFERLRNAELNADSQRSIEEVTWTPYTSQPDPDEAEDDDEAALFHPPPPTLSPLPELVWEPLSGKPWFVVATKADQPKTRPRFRALQAYLQDLAAGNVPHPSGVRHAWRERLHAIPVSAMRGEGVERVPGVVMDLLD